MTFCETLKKGKTPEGCEVYAVREMDKYSAVWRYSVDFVENGVCFHSVKCARTTWKKRFEEAEEGRYGF